MRSANFVEETTTSIAGTGGNGAITLTAIASTPRFSTVFGTQATTIRYVIEDTVGKRFETGIGSVAANVLTRTRPQVTWDGTTYDDSTPAPIAFGSAPASGNIKVRLSATAESQGANMPGVQTTIGADPFREFAVSGHSSSSHNGTPRGMVAAQEYYYAYRNDRAGMLDAVRFQVAAVGGTGCKAAIYNIGVDGLPSNKLRDFNIIPTTSTGVMTDSATGTWSPTGPVYLTPGWYFIGLIFDGTPSLTGDNNGIRSEQPTPLGRGNIYGYALGLRISGKSYAAGLPALPSMSGAILMTSTVDAIQLGLRVTP